MSPSPAELEQWMATGARLQQLVITGAQRPGVLQSLERLAAMAELVNTFRLPDGVEPAPQFEP